ncbi:MAG: NUDIX domain-containing protein [Proteobacteria bacterium]|nr:NUDIX domain-containing protein [Pseudomonadota bacterium]
MSCKDDVFWAGGFLYDRAGESVFLHKRDGNTLASPHKWAFFGGHNEGAESALDCFVRELEEEIGLKIRRDEAKWLREYLNTDTNEQRIVFFVEKAVPVEQLVLGEGAGFAWFKLDEVRSLDLSDKTRLDFEYFLSHMS